MSVKGSPYKHFRAALTRGDLAGVLAAASELPRVNLVDALEVCLLLAEKRDRRLDRAATRWLARFALEHPRVGIVDLRTGMDALAALTTHRVTATNALAGLCDTHGLRGASAMLRGGAIETTR